jgi:hypothetical protein
MSPWLALSLWACTGSATSEAPPPALSRTPVQIQPPDCVAVCLRDNMARATAPEIIAGDCERACDPKSENGHALITP